MKRFLNAPILLLCIVLGTRSSLAQGGLNSDGRDYYLGLLTPSYNAQEIDASLGNVQGYYSVYALISTYENNQVTLGYFDENGQEVLKTTYNVSRRRSITVPLDVSRMTLQSPRSAPQYRSCHITAKKPISVQYRSMGACAGGAYHALATNVLGKTYVVESYHDNPGGIGGDASNEDAAGYFMIIAAFDGTHVTITPTATTKDNHAGVHCGPGATNDRQPFTVGLRRGQCYFASSIGTQIDCDISGSTIVSDQPIAVIAGHENALTDGSDSQPVENGRLEARNHLVQQMIPVEYWDSTGYVSIPFLDSGLPAKDGFGDEYRVFPGILPELGPARPDHADVSISGTSRTFPNVEPYTQPLPHVPSVTSPVHIHSTNGSKIGAAMYDQRMQGVSAPYPSPTQLTLIPISKWQSTYLFEVPNFTSALQQGNYINLICSKQDFNGGQILCAVDDGKVGDIRTFGLVRKRQFNAIPDHPELVGLTYSVSPGTYFITSSTTTPFIVYCYGFEGMSPDGRLGDLSGNDMYCSYAFPAGFTDAGDSGDLSITVDTICDHWHICIRDGRQNAPGIKSLQILDDPSGDFIRPPMVSRNVIFDPRVDPDKTFEIDLQGTDTMYCADVFVSNPLDSGGAFGAIYILDNLGNDYLIRLYYALPKYSIAVEAPALKRGDTISFPRTKLGTNACSIDTIRNTGATTDQPISISSIRLLRPNSRFSLTGVPTQPVWLPAGGSLTVRLCYLAADTSVYLDTLSMQVGCRTIRTILVGSTKSDPLATYSRIEATDRSFGQVSTGATKCSTVTVSNVGTLPFTVLGVKNPDSLNFSLDAGSALKLPETLDPGYYAMYTFCYHPSRPGSDSARIDWITTIGGDYHDSTKAWSLLSGTSIGAGVANGNGNAEAQLRVSCSNSNLVIHTPYLVGATPRFDLFDLLGHNLRHWEDIPIDEAGMVSLPIGSIEKGTYILRARSGAQTAYSKFAH